MTDLTSPYSQSSPPVLAEQLGAVSRVVEHLPPSPSSARSSVSGKTMVVLGSETSSGSTIHERGSVPPPQSLRRSARVQARPPVLILDSESLGCDLDFTPAEPMPDGWSPSNIFQVSHPQSLLSGLPPTDFVVADALEAGAGRASYIKPSRNISAGTVMGKYFGSGTMDGTLFWYPGLTDFSATRGGEGAYLLSDRKETFCVDGSIDCVFSYCNDLMKPGNIFFHEAPSGRPSMLAIARQTFLAGRWYQQHVNYGKEYWRKFAYRLPPSARARCLEFYQLDPSECESGPTGPADTLLLPSSEVDLSVPSLSFLSSNDDSVVREFESQDLGEQLLIDGSAELSQLHPAMASATYIPEERCVHTPLPVNHHDAAECLNSPLPSDESPNPTTPTWIDALLDDSDEVILDGSLPSGVESHAEGIESNCSDLQVQPGQTVGGDDTWEGIILLVEAVELSAEGMQQEASLDSSAAQQRRISTESVQRFREKVGPKWRVLTLYRDVWYQTHRHLYSNSCLCLDYNDPTLGDQLRRAGFPQPIRHVIINPVGSQSQVLAQRYPSPLEIFGWCKGKRPCAVWMPDHPDITRLLSARNHRHELCQGHIVGGMDLMQEWAASQPIDSKLRPQCRQWDAFPLSVGIMWDGRPVKHTKEQWLLNLHLAEWGREKTLPCVLRWPGPSDLTDNRHSPSSQNMRDVSTSSVMNASMVEMAPHLAGGSFQPTVEGDGYQALKEMDESGSIGSGMPTDVQLIRRLNLLRQSVNGQLPQINSVPDKDITYYYGLCHSRGVPLERHMAGKGGLYTSMAVAAGDTILIPLGKILTKPTQKPVLPQLPLPDGRWFAVSSTMWDVALTTSTTVLLEPKHAHLTPFLHLTSDRSAANCDIGYSETGHPLIQARYDLEQGEWIVLYVGGVIAQEVEPLPTADDQSTPDTTELLEVQLSGSRPSRPSVQGTDKTDDKWIWWETEPPTEEEELSGWDDGVEVEKPPPKPPNLGLGTVNLNGK